MNKFFPDFLAARKAALYVESLPGAPAVGPDNEEVRLWSEAAVQAVLANPHAIAMGTTCLWYYNSSENTFFRQQLLRNGGRATALVFNLAKPDGLKDGTHLTELLLNLREYRGETDLDESLYFVGSTGDAMIDLDSRLGIGYEEFKVECVTIPPAVLILYAFVQRIKFLLIPLVTMLTSLAVSYALGNVCTLYMNVFSLAPVMMQAVIVAFNVDYNLFLLARYLEMQAQGVRPWANLCSLVGVTAFGCVFVSGTLVAFAFFSLTLIPVETLFAFGVTCGATILTCVAVNCTVTPAILVLFGDVLSSPLPDACGKRRSVAAAGSSGNAATDPLLPPASSTVEGFTAATTELQRRSVQERSLLFRWGKVVAGQPALVLAVFIVSGAFFYVHLGQAFARTAVDPLEGAQYSVASVQTYRRVEATFSPGQLSPFFLVLECADDSISSIISAYEGANGCYSPIGYMAMHWITSELMKDPVIADNALHAFLGPTFAPINFTSQVLGLDRSDPMIMESCSMPLLSLPGICDMLFAEADEQPEHITFDEAVVILNMQVPENDLSPADSNYDTVQMLLDEASSMQSAYRLIYDTQVSHDAGLGRGHGGMLTQVMLDINTGGYAADLWIDRARGVLDEFKQQGFGNGYGAYLSHARSCTLHDYNRAVEETMPFMLTCLVCAVIAFVAYVFKSLPIALMMGASIVYSVAISLGVTYFALQTDSLYWLVPSLEYFDNGGMCWAVLPLMTAIMAALAMDYDVFIASTIAEHRQHNYTTEAAVLKALAEAGPTIASAALVMMVSFGGLTISTVMVLKQCGIVLFVAILLDGFVLALTLLPAAMFIFGRGAWWPGDASLPGPSWQEEGSRGVDDCMSAGDDASEGSGQEASNAAPMQGPPSAPPAPGDAEKRLVIGCGAGLCVILLCLAVATRLFWQDLRCDFAGITVREASFDGEAQQLELETELDLTLTNPNWVGATVSKADVAVWYHPTNRNATGCWLAPASMYVADVVLAKSVDVTPWGTESLILVVKMVKQVFASDGAEILPCMMSDCAISSQILLELIVDSLTASVLGGFLHVDVNGVVDVDVLANCRRVSAG